MEIQKISNQDKLKRAELSFAILHYSNVMPLSFKFLYVLFFKTFPTALFVISGSLSGAAFDSLVHTMSN